ncbi:MAG: RNA polymerase subunit sigma-24 [Acetobacterium sp. MES1]|uniref:Sigma-70 family RNA polymerase sigma factor n=1 Tax=Acetobacterium wieringae TaxID=52694 RepID=A0A5D0WQA2_9FIRM|nr:MULTISPECIES: sigma factor-like helix-turn-helix DNA-binding protein [Acetobacterium]OXS26571.1 MAG: RNA polymerase subunit sigma-24 [Acetobacterium sp. MES1]TYC86482.1 sigma-70 family RNA polymerase sigma factor [Acetobacterium wieringae]
MRKFKTPEKNRPSYTYYSVDGSKIKITPDEEGVTNTVISTLHAWDDQEFDAERRENYHVPVHLESYQDTSDDDATDRNPYLIDPAPNPVETLIKSIDADEHEARLEKLKTAIDTLQLQQKVLIQKVFYEGRTYVDIAAEEGVTEAAIRNRLKKIFNNLRKKI